MIEPYERKIFFTSHKKSFIKNTLYLYTYLLCSGVCNPGQVLTAANTITFHSKTLTYEKTVDIQNLEYNLNIRSIEERNIFEVLFVQWVQDPGGTKIFHV